MYDPYRIPRQEIAPAHDPQSAASQELLVSGLEQHLAAASDFVFADTTGPYTAREKEEGEIQPSSIHWYKNGVLGLHNKAIPIAVSYLLQQSELGEPESEEAFVREVVGTHLGELADQPGLAHIYIRVLAATERVRTLREHVDHVVTPLHELVADSPERQYGLLKMLTEEPDSSAPVSDMKQQSALQTLYAFSYLDQGRPAQFQSLEANFENGDYDTMIAAELLAEVAGLQAENVNGLADLKNLIDMAVLLGESAQVDEAIAKLSRAEVLATWPPVCKRILGDRKNNFRHKIRERRDVEQQYLDTMYCIFPPQSTITDVERSLEDLTLAIYKQFSTDTHAPVAQRIAARTVVQTARRRKAETIAAQEQEASDKLESSEVAPRQRSLAYISASGEEVAEGDLDEKTHGDLFAQYLARNHSQYKVKDDLERIAELLKEADFTHGLPRGFYKHNDGKGVTYGGRDFDALYELNIKSAQISTKSRNGHKLRVFFVLLDEGTKVGVLGIGHKNEVDKILLRLGGKGKPKRKS